MDGDGGFINAGSTFDLRFSSCSFDQNTASEQTVLRRDVALLTESNRWQWRRDLRGWLA